MENLKKFNVIVAACANGGIGMNGGMPWTLRGDLKLFAKLTTETRDPAKRNAVVMGRKTWFAIPEKHRPLKNRINVVISQTLSGLSPPAVYQVASIEAALQLLTSETSPQQLTSEAAPQLLTLQQPTSQQLTSDTSPQLSVSKTSQLLLTSEALLKNTIETIWFIGGQSLYHHAMESPYLDKVYFTRILRDFECDAFFPIQALEKMKRVEDERVTPNQQEENGVPYVYEVYSTEH